MLTICDTQMLMSLNRRSIGLDRMLLYRNQCQQAGVHIQCCLNPSSERASCVRCFCLDFAVRTIMWIQPQPWVPVMKKIHVVSNHDARTDPQQYNITAWVCNPRHATTFTAKNRLWSKEEIPIKGYRISALSIRSLSALHPLLGSNPASLFGCMGALQGLEDLS